jgi:hypothetical protein
MMPHGDMTVLYRIEDENDGDGQRYAQPATPTEEREHREQRDGWELNAMDKSRQLTVRAFFLEFRKFQDIESNALM